MNGWQSMAAALQFSRAGKRCKRLLLHSTGIANDVADSSGCCNSPGKVRHPLLKLHGSHPFDPFPRLEMAAGEKV